MLNAEQRQHGRDIANQLKDFLQLDSCYFSQPNKDKKRVRFYLKSGGASLSVPISKRVVFNEEHDMKTAVLQAVIRAWIAELEYRQGLIDGGVPAIIKKLSAVR